MSHAARIEDRAARWLIRREETEWTEADQLELDAWLSESMAHKAAFWRLEHGWREADLIVALGGDPPLAERGRPRWLQRRWVPAAIAASLIAVVGLGFGTISGFGPNSTTVVADARFDTPVGGRRLIPLPDGSTVEMNTQSVLRTEVTLKSRDVWLDHGEAYFEVAHVENRPFIVHAGAHRITVLGTKFSVRLDGGNVTVAVVEGKVRLDVSDGRKLPPAFVTAGEVATADGGSTLLAPRSEESVENGLAWRSGMLSFDQATLAEVATEFNRYNRKQIEISDPAAANIRIGGTFQASNVDAFARLLRDAYGLRVETGDASIKISS